MSLYKPISSATRAALGVSGSVLNGVAGNLTKSLNLGDNLGGKLANTALTTATNLGVSEITRRVSNPLMNAANKLDTRLKNIARKGLAVFGLNAFDNNGLADNSLQHMGNLSIRQVWENYKLMNVDELSRKNFFVLEINDRSNSAPTSGGDIHSQFNLLATQLSFNSVDIQGEAIQIGAVEMDKPSANSRTTLSLTVMDDQYGTIKRWAENKAQMIAASDGTFMPPAYYVFDVRIMFGTNVADESYYEQIYTMRMQTMPHELSRHDKGLEELQFTFAQTDTFMPHWI